jgi:tetratricopeptide (TPR) repeat protein
MRSSEHRRARLIAALRAGEARLADRIVGEALAARPDDRFWRAALAGRLVARGQHREALALAEQVLREAPGHAASLTVRAEALLALGRDREAQAAAEAAWRRRPTAYRAGLLARACARRDPEGAIALARRASERFPRDARLAALLGLLLERAGRPDEAGEAYRRAGGAYAGGGHGFAYARRLRLLLARRAPEEALDEVERVLRVPSLAAIPELLDLRGELLTRLGRHDEAADAFALAAAGAPHRPRYTARRAYALRRAGRRLEAQPLLQRVIEARSRDPVALAAYVADARSLGRAAEARAFLRGVLARHPERRHLWGWLLRLAAVRPEGG